MDGVGQADSVKLFMGIGDRRQVILVVVMSMVTWAVFMSSF